MTEQDLGQEKELAGSVRADVVSANRSETRRLGRCLGSLLRQGDLLLLNGPFGAGKTTLTQGIAQGLGVKDVVTSPSFTLVNQYRGPRGRATILYHIDLYRIESPVEALDLGIEEYVTEQAICVIEWPEHARLALPEHRLEIDMAFLGETGRRIALVSRGERYVELVAAFKAQCVPPTLKT